MIEFKELEFRNFLSYGNSFTKWNFQKGITRITGQNGKGKSSCVDAIYFGLFGKAFRKQKLSQLINWVNKKELEVKLTFSVNGIDFKIERGLKPDYLKIYKSVNSEFELIPVDSNKALYQKIIEDQIIKMDEDVFNQTVIKSMTKNVSFMNLSKGEKRSIIESIFDLEIFTDMNKLNKLKIQECKQQIDINAEKINGINTNIQNELENIQKLKLIKEKLIKENNDKILNSKNEISNFRNQIKDYENQIENSKNQILDFKAQIKDYENQIENSKDKVKDYENEILDFKYQINNYEQEIISLTSQIDEYESNIQENKETQEKYELAIQKLKKYKSKAKDIKEQIKVNKQEISIKESTTIELKSEITVQEQKISLFAKTCPECPKIKTMKNDDDLVSKKEKLNQIEKEVSDLNLNIEELENKLNKIQKFINEENNYLNNIETAKSNINKYENSIEKTKKQILTFKDNIEKTKQNIIKTKDNIEKTKSSTTLKDNIEKTKQNIINTEKHIINIKDNIEKTKQNIITIENQIKKLEKPIDIVEIDESKYLDLKKQKQTLTEIHNTLSKDKRHFEALKKILSDDGIKAFIISQYLPSINKILNKYLQKFDTNILFYFDTEFNEVIKSKNKEKSNYNCFSEGQKRRIDLSILFTFIEFSQIKNRRSNTNILILDEITPGLDIYGENTLFDVLRDIAEKENKEVITISQSTHIEQDKIDRTFEVVTENYFSKMNLLDL